jgi:hypothetical protein
LYLQTTSVPEAFEGSRASAILTFIREALAPVACKNQLRRLADGQEVGFAGAATFPA